MAVTQAGRSFIMTALNDTIAQRILVTSIALVGTSMTAGQRLTITDNDGSVIADHYVEAANENAEFVQGSEQWFTGVKLTAVPAGGTWTVIVRYR